MSISLMVSARINNGSVRRRLFHQDSTRCSFCSAGGSRRKRRKGKLPLAPTKKDRIRSLEKKPEPTFEMPSIDLNKVGDTLESRLTQAQDYVYQFWRGTDAAKQQQARPKRATLNMDSRWWFWNILLMAMPGIMIALYCEFKAKPEMHELLGKLDEEQRQRILGGTLEAEEEIFEMGEQDVQRIQESVNEEFMGGDDNDDEENLSLLALKQRLDALEAQLSKKDQQLNHLRRYQLERTQQSGIQNRIEDKMISEWKSQSKQAPATPSYSSADKDDSLSERMKEAVLHGFGENLEAKKAILKSYGEKGLEYGRQLFYGEDEPAPSPNKEEKPAPSPEGDSKNDSRDQVVKHVSEAAAHTTRAADIVSPVVSSSSSDAQDLSRAAAEASVAATEASHAAQAAAASAVSQSQPRFLSRQWNKLFRRKSCSQEESNDDS